MKVLVTGAAGYLGSVLSPLLLERRHCVLAYDNMMFGGEGLLPLKYSKNFEMVNGDTRDSKKMKQALKGMDAVCHLAALVGEPACMENPALTKEINCHATISLAKSAKKSGIKRFIFTSTCSNYGVSHPDQLATEDSELNPLSLYAETKIMAERELLKLNDKNFHVYILRLSTLFGLSAKMRFNLLINEMVRESYYKQKIILYKELAWRPYAHIYDAAACIARVLEYPLEKKISSVYNVGTQNFQKKDLVKILKKYIPNFTVENKGGMVDNRDYRVSFEKIKKELNFKPKKTVEEGIEEMSQAIKNRVFKNPYDERYTMWIDEPFLLSNFT